MRTVSTNVFVSIAIVKTRHTIQMRALLLLLALLHLVACDIVTINNLDDIIIFGGNISMTLLTPTLSEQLRALASTNPKVALAMGQTYGGLNAQLAWNWLLAQYPPFQTPLDYESGLFSLNGSTAGDINIALWEYALLMAVYTQPGCASGWVPNWTEQNTVACTQLLDIDVAGDVASTGITYLAYLFGLALAIGIVYLLGGMYVKSRARKIP